MTMDELLANYEEELEIDKEGSLTLAPESES